MDRRSFFGALIGGAVGAVLAPFAVTSAPARGAYEPPTLRYIGRIEPPLPEWYRIAGWTQIDEYDQVIAWEITEVSRCGTKMRIRRSIRLPHPIEFIPITFALAQQ